MAPLSYVADLHAKGGLRLSWQAVKRAVLALTLALCVAGASYFGYDYITTGQYLESTDDAYVKADSTIVSPKVSGYIVRVLVADNELVTAGQLLARGNFTGRTFELSRGLSVVASVTQQRALRERFAVEVADGEDAVLMLAAILVIEIVRDERRQSAAAASAGG